MGQTRFASGRRLDLICLGRPGRRPLCAASQGAVGRCFLASPNTSVDRPPTSPSARLELGLKSAMLSRGEDDHMGRFLVEYLTREGCDVSGIEGRSGAADRHGPAGPQGSAKPFRWSSTVKTAPTWRCGLKTSAKPIIASGGALADHRRPVLHCRRLRRRASEAGYAEKHNVKQVLDIDYRPVLWGLATARPAVKPASSPTRTSASMCKKILPRFDLIVGTEEEIRDCRWLRGFAHRAAQCAAPGPVVINSARKAAQ